MKKKGKGGRTKVDTPARAKQKRFLAAYALLGTVTHAAESANVDRAMHYRWLEEDTYAKEFQAASDRFVDRVRDAVRQRAVDGWLDPIVYQGKIQRVAVADPAGDGANYSGVRYEVAGVRKFSDRILELLAKGKVPEFKDKLELDAGGTLGEIVARSYGNGKEAKK